MLIPLAIEGACIEARAKGARIEAQK